MTKRESIEWSNIWISEANATGMSRALLVGDSIAQSYFDGVEKALKDRFLCARLATSKSICDPSFRK